jgi:hypothetical protein
MIVELLEQTNEVLMDMQWVEGNLPTGHRTTVRTGLPATAWRLLNQGVQPSKSTTTQIDEAVGILEAWSEVDKDLAELNGNTAAFRLSEAQAFLESMNQEFVQTLFYGNSSTAPEEFTGLSVRYSDTTATNGQNIITGGGAGADNTSIWFIVWGSNTFHGIFPKGSKAGLQQKCGIALRDWRYVVRIPNIDVSNLVSKTSAADLIELMIRAYHRVPTMGPGKACFYMNRTVFQMLDIQRRDDAQSGGQLNYQVIDGVMTPFFRGMPIRRVDQLLETEALVS